MLIALFNAISYCQLIVDAGYDNAVCFNEGIMDSVRLGGNPTATGGSGTYNYCWEAYYHLSGSQYHFYASYFIDDTTSSNPLLIHRTTGSDLVFKLTVSDTAGNISIDSCRIIFSLINISLLDYIFYLPEGDSTYLCQGGLIDSKLPLDSIAWMPSTGVSSPHEPCTWVHPDTYTEYGVYIRDTAGCYGFSGPRYFIHIIPQNLEENETSTIKVFFNQSDQKLFISGWEFLVNPRIQLFSINGILLSDQKITKNEIDLGRYNNSTMFYIIRDQDRDLEKGKLILF
ncbi:MAG: hypothetical protein GX660_03805 [Clostridiaceae bacterium]|nr:hypothetical protein [Clostridiaceae bacterium]